MKKTYLQTACRNHYGYIDVTPGTDIAHRLTHVSPATIRRYIQKGWLKHIGTGLVLTQAGYDHA